MHDLSRLFFDGGRSADDETNLVLTAVRHTAALYGIAPELFGDFLASMRMDLTVTDYPDRAALNRYMHGSAEVIGLQLLPVLGTVGPAEEAAPYAAALGKAFQLTNFLRDVDEDLTRQRVYLPADELAAFGVDRDLLAWCHENRRTDPRVRSALAEQHRITRGIYRFAAEGVADAGAVVAPLCGHCAHAVLGDPRPHRGHRLRGVQPARPGRDGASPAGGRGCADPSLANTTRKMQPRKHGSLAVPDRARRVPG